MTPHQAVFLLVDLAVIVILSQAFGALATRLRQPPVIGEIAAGILVGPTLIGSGLSAGLFPTDVRPFLTAVANIGVAMFMFLIGAELNRDLLRRQGPVAASVSVSSILLPFGLGAGLAVYLYQHHPVEHRLGFVLFLGTAMSVTAFPVLARILTDRGIRNTELGTLALASAAIDDVLAWTLLAVVIAVSGATTHETWLLLIAIPYIATMIWVVRPLLSRCLRRDGGSTTTLGVICAGVLLSGAITEWIGLHLIFGAFLFGAVLPRDLDRQPRTALLDSVSRFTLALLLPAFFVVAGLKVDLSRLDPTALLEFVLVLVVAVAGKFGGAYLAARAHRMPPRRSALLATLMNTRGLTELIILTVGLQIGLLDQQLYSIMVVMALVTTAMAGPLLSALGVDTKAGTGPEPAPAEPLRRPS